jgi:cytochrome c peroxidase
MELSMRNEQSSTLSNVLFPMVVLLLVGAAGYAQAPDLEGLKRDYRRPPSRAVENQALVDLGRDLFFESRISASGNTACASCHFPQLGWAVAEARSRNDSGKLTARKSQPVIGLGYAGDAPIGWDGRSPTLEAQAKTSIATGSMSMRDTDTPIPVGAIEQRIRTAPDYVAKFKAALPSTPIDIDAIAQAVAAFERAIEPDIAPFDRWVDGDDQAISDSAKRGFALFTGKALCSACHRGWRFTDDQFHDIGIATTDRGRGNEVKDEKFNFAFKTPTLRSVSLRPPYMHDGSIATLDEVVRLYEKGGVDRPSRSPLMQPLHLSDQERLDLVAFMDTLTGGAMEGPRTIR